MLSGDNRCLLLGPAAGAGSPANLCRRGEPAAAAAATTIRLRAAGQKRAQQPGGSIRPTNTSGGSSTGQQQQQVLSSSSANELLKLTNLRLHDDDSSSNSNNSDSGGENELGETTKAGGGGGSGKLDSEDRARKHKIEAPPPGNRHSSSSSRMLVVESPMDTCPGDSGAGRQRLANGPGQLVELDHSAGAHYSADYTQHNSPHPFHHHDHSSGAQFVSSSGYSLELDSSYAAGDYGSHEYLVGGQQLEFLELEPGDSSLRHQLGSKQQQPVVYQQQQANSSFGPTSSGHYDSATNPSSYLSLEPAPAPSTTTATMCGAYDCDLPDSVIRLNYQQQQLAGFSAGHQVAVSTIQFGGGDQPHYGYPADQTLHNHQHSQQQQPLSSQQQDSGHASCVDSAGSLVLSGGSCQLLHHQQQQHPQQHQAHSSSTGSLYQHHHHRPQSHHHHQQQQQQQAEAELKVCEWEGCEHTFLDMQEFVKHLEDRHVNQEPKEKNRYFCLWSNCKRNAQEFNARYKLLIHMRVHSGEKPYPCNNANCRKSFSRLENLKIHQRSHTGEKPYKCIFDGCSKSFTNSSDRIKHHKTHKDPKPYSCNYNGCSKRYTDPSSLRKHLRAHKRAHLQLPGGSQEQLLLEQSASSGCWRLQHHQPQQQQQPHQELAGCCSSSYDPNCWAFEQTAGAQFGRDLYPDPAHHNQTSTNLTSQPADFYGGGPSSSSSLLSQQHSQLSRSWCAGSTSSLQQRHSLAAGPQRPHTGALPLGPAHLASSAGHHPSPQHLNQLRAASSSQHETLMRSLPPGGFRVPHARMSHAHAEWPAAAGRPSGP